MNGAQVEAFLAALYTDPNLLKRFEADPEAVCRSAGLAGDELASILSLNLSDLSYAARSFGKKRARKSRKKKVGGAIGIRHFFARLFART